MRKQTRGLVRGSALAVTAAVAVGALMVPATAQSNSTKPQATEIGVSATEIHIGVVADVDNSLAPNLFKSAVDGVKAGAAYLNSKAGGGGVGGRKVVVDFWDSKLNPTASRTATINACENDFAMVGTSAVQLTSVDDIVNCVDEAGQATGLPDITAVPGSTAEVCAPVAFPVTGRTYDCSTLSLNPQTYYGNQGEPKWLLSQHKGGLHGPMIVSADARNPASTALTITAQKAGIKADQGTVAVSAIAPQSAYTGIVQQMKADGSNYSLTTTAASAALSLRNEANLQGLDSSKIVWGTVSAYGNAIVPANADAFEGEYQALSFLPFEEAKSNKTLANFMTYMKKVGGKPDQFGAYAWSATLAFADGARAVVDGSGVNGLTRTAFIDRMKTLTDYDAGGMFGTHSFQTGRVTSCFVEVRFLNGKWVRQYPAKPGTFDCKASNGITFQANLVN